MPTSPRSRSSCRARFPSGTSTVTPTSSDCSLPSVNCAGLSDYTHPMSTIASVNVGFSLEPAEQQR